MWMCVLLFVKVGDFIVLYKPNWSSLFSWPVDIDDGVWQRLCCANAFDPFLMPPRVSWRARLLSIFLQGNKGTTGCMQNRLHGVISHTASVCSMRYSLQILMLIAVINLCIWTVQNKITGKPVPVKISSCYIWQIKTQRRLQLCTQDL